MTLDINIGLYFVDCDDSGSGDDARVNYDYRYDDNNKSNNTYNLIIEVSVRNM